MKTNLVLQKNYGYSLSDLENMLPWERLVYLDMLKMQNEEEAIRKHDEMNMQKDLNNFMRKARK